MSRLSEAYVEIRGDSSRLPRDFAHVRSYISNAIANMNANVKIGSSSFGGGLLGSLLGTAGIAGISTAMSGVKSLASAMVGGAAELQGYSTSWRVLLGSTAEAGKRMAELTRFADTTPFGLTEVMQASRNLQVFTNGTLATGDALRSIGDAAALTQQRFQDVSFWVGRMYSSLQNGQPFGESAMRLQEMGILTGNTRAAMERLAKSGGSAADVYKLFGRDLDKFSGGMAEMAKTTKGLWSTLGDGVSRVLSTIGEGLTPAIDSVQRALISMTDGVLPTIRFMSSAIGPALKSATDSVIAFVSHGAASIGKFMSRNVDSFKKFYGYTVLVFQTLGAYTSTIFDYMAGRSEATSTRFGASFASMWESVSPMMFALGETFVMVVSDMGGFWDTAVAQMAASFSRLNDHITKNLNLMEIGYRSIVMGIVSGVAAIPEAIAAGRDAIKTLQYAMALGAGMEVVNVKKQIEARGGNKVEDFGPSKATQELQAEADRRANDWGKRYAERLEEIQNGLKGRGFMPGEPVPKAPGGPKVPDGGDVTRGGKKDGFDQIGIVDYAKQIQQGASPAEKATVETAKNTLAILKAQTRANEIALANARNQQLKDNGGLVVGVAG